MSTTYSMSYILKLLYVHCSLYACTCAAQSATFIIVILFHCIHWHTRVVLDQASDHTSEQVTAPYMGISLNHWQHRQYSGSDPMPFPQSPWQHSRLLAKLVGAGVPNFFIYDSNAPELHDKLNPGCHLPQSLCPFLRIIVVLRKYLVLHKHVTGHNWTTWLGKQCLVATHDLVLLFLWLICVKTFILPV